MDLARRAVKQSNTQGRATKRRIKIAEGVNTMISATCKHELLIGLLIACSLLLIVSTKREDTRAKYLKRSSEEH